MLLGSCSEAPVVLFSVVYRFVAVFYKNSTSAGPLTQLNLPFNNQHAHTLSRKRRRLRLPNDLATLRTMSSLLPRDNRPH